MQIRPLVLVSMVAILSGVRGLVRLGEAASIAFSFAIGLLLGMRRRCSRR